MKSSEIDQELFTESYCRVCSAQLISESQRVAHYEVRSVMLEEGKRSSPKLILTLEKLTYKIRSTSFVCHYTQTQVWNALV
uniref:Zinc finger matrin-type 4 n=1 Tax=Pseudonaja textilis TaxID=8673 RepID=A0A670Z4D1_PSETE